MVGVPNLERLGARVNWGDFVEVRVEVWVWVVVAVAFSVPTSVR